MVVHEDNESTIAIAIKGHSPSLRALCRTQRISLGVCHETYYEPAPQGCGSNLLIYTNSKSQKGDLLTKYLDKGDLEHALEMIQVKRLSHL